VLNKWEQERWASIERELAGDRRLSTAFEARRTPHLWAVLRDVFWPAGYVACTVVFMLVALGGAARIIGGILLCCTVLCIVAEVRARRAR
jgi:hypothetical protein